MTSELLNSKVNTLTARSKEFDIDNGNGTTLDDVILRCTHAIKLVAARIIYTDATAGTVAAATVQIGTTVTGVDVVAATAYGNAKAVGTVTALVLALAQLAANTPVIVRHTGIASTVAGRGYVELDYIPLDD